MIIDLAKFREQESPYWSELERFLNLLEADYAAKLSLEDARKLHYLYRRAAGSLARLQTFASEPDTVSYLEALVARAYGELHETRSKENRFRPLSWLVSGFPNAFRRHYRAFLIATLTLVLGSIFGGGVMLLDPASKEHLMPFSHLLGSPEERVAHEEKAEFDPMKDSKATFSAQLMTNNIRVSIVMLALGMTYGIGTVVLLFYNGAILGVVAVDYCMAGQTKFLLGWLLPHGVIEIPAILIGGQAGLVIGSALIGWGKRKSLGIRLREILPDVCFLLYGFSVMLVWAGIIESFLSQYHEPAISYSTKITFGVLELVGLSIFLVLSGRKESR